VIVKAALDRLLGEGVGSYFPPVQAAASLFLQVSVDCNKARRNSLSAAAIF
jgi:hypothetical protein